MGVLVVFEGRRRMANESRWIGARRRHSKGGYALLAMVAGLVWGTERSAQALEPFPSLDEAIAQARSHAPSVVDAEGALRVAQSGEVGARVSVLGNPSIQALVDRGRFTSDVQIQTQMTFPVDLQGQRGARIAEWERLVAWKRAAKVDSEGQTTGDTVAAYGNVLLARGRLAQAEQAEQTSRAELDMVTARLRAGDATAYDLHVAQSEASRWSELRVLASVGLTQALAQLALRTGRTTAPPTVSDAEPPRFRGVFPSGDAVAYLADSPMLRALDAEAVYWQARADRERAEGWTPFGLMVSAGRGDLGEPRAGAGVAYTFPFFRRNQGDVARSRSEEARLAMVRSALREVLASRLKGAIDTYRQGLQGVETIEKEGIPATEALVVAAAEEQKAGKGEKVRVLLARRDLASARLRRLDLVQWTWSAYADIALLKGTLP